MQIFEGQLSQSNIKLDFATNYKTLEDPVIRADKTRI